MTYVFWLKIFFGFKMFTTTSKITLCVQENKRLLKGAEQDNKIDEKI